MKGLCNISGGGNEPFKDWIELGMSVSHHDRENSTFLINPKNPTGIGGNSKTVTGEYIKVQYVTNGQSKITILKDCKVAYRKIEGTTLTIENLTAGKEIASNYGSILCAVIGGE